jgi:hypothetical protein
MLDIGSDSTYDSSAPDALYGYHVAHMSSYTPYLSGPSLDVFQQGDSDSNTSTGEDSGMDSE